VASLNLHCGFGSRGEPFDVAGAICRLDAAVTCLQEVWLPAANGPIADGSPAQPADHVSDAAVKLGAVVHSATMGSWPSVASLGIATESGPGELCIAVVTTLPVTGYKVLELGAAPGDGIPRLAQIISIRLPDGSGLRVVNTHLTHAGTSLLQLLRLRQRLYADSSQAGPVPTVIAGDLNMPRLLAGRIAGYAAAARGATWPAEQPLVQLDHILASQDIERIDGVVLTSVGSDHLPIRAQLRIRGSQPR